MNAEQELDAIRRLTEVLGALPPEAQHRVLRWAAEFYGANHHIETSSLPPNWTPAPTEQRAVHNQFEFADLFHKLNPSSEREKALVASYWVATNNGEETFSSAAVNQLLRDLGYRIANVTDALTQLAKEKPARVIQVRKSGTTKQARKTYKITVAGIQSVEEELQARR